MVSQMSNEINPLALRSTGELVVSNLFERGVRCYVPGVNSFPPLGGQFLAAVSSRNSSAAVSSKKTAGSPAEQMLRTKTGIEHIVELDPGR